MNDFEDIFKPISTNESIDRMFPFKNGRTKPFNKKERAALTLLIDCFNCKTYKSLYVTPQCIECKKKVTLLNKLQIECIRENIVGKILPPLFYDALGWKKSTLF